MDYLEGFTFGGGYNACVVDADGTFFTLAAKKDKVAGLGLVNADIMTYGALQLAARWQNVAKTLVDVSCKTGAIESRGAFGCRAIGAAQELPCKRNHVRAE